jgi:hypothetical protein
MAGDRKKDHRLLPIRTLAFYGDTPSKLSVTETHETACASVAAMEYSFGYLKSVK